MKSTQIMISQQAFDALKLITQYQSFLTGKSTTMQSVIDGVLTRHRVLDDEFYAQLHVVSSNRTRSIKCVALTASVLNKLKTVVKLYRNFTYSDVIIVAVEDDVKSAIKALNNIHNIRAPQSFM